jgi:YVTN family beta-propeller protein
MQRLFAALLLWATLAGLAGGCGGSDTAESSSTRVAERPTGPEVIFEGVTFRPVEPETTINVGAPGLWSLAATENFLWATSDQGIHRIDPHTAEAELVLADSVGMSIDADEAGVWATSFEENVVRRIDPVSGKVVATIKVGINPEQVAVTDDAVWVTNHRGGDVARIDPASNRVVARIEVGPKGRGGPQSIGVGAGSIWVGVPNASSVVRIDPATNEVIETIDVDIPGAAPCGGFAFDEPVVWLTHCSGLSILRIDAQTNEPTALLSLGARPGSPVFVTEQLWVPVGPREAGEGAPGGLVQIDPDNTMVDAIDLGEDFEAQDTVFAFGALWVADFERGTIVGLSPEALSG